MTIAVARPFLVKAIEGLVPTDSRAFTANTKFKHEPSLASDPVDEEARSRSFYVELIGPGQITGPYMPDLQGQPRVTIGVRLAIVYRGGAGKNDDLDVNMESDALDVAKLLERPGTYSPRTTSNIDYVDKITWRRENIPGGNKRTLFTFEMHYL